MTVSADTCSVSAVSSTLSDPVALDDALQALAVFDPRKAQVIELRFFGQRTPVIGFAVGMAARAMSIGVGVKPNVCSVSVESSRNGRVHW